MNLRTIEGWWVGYDNSRYQQPLYSPLEYLNRCNPKTAIFPKGFRLMLVENCPLAAFEWKNGRKVHGFRSQDILEQNFSYRTKW